MKNDESLINPFQITSPEDLTANETISLFVDVFTDFQKIKDPGHVFLKGPRGVGKSMMFRYLQSDCQCMVLHKDFSELPFLGIYIPLKNTNFSLTELRRFEHRHASEILNEHILVTYFCLIIFETILKQESFINSHSSLNSFLDYYNDIYIKNLNRFLSDKIEYYYKKDTSIEYLVKNIIQNSDNLYSEAFGFAKKLAFSQDLVPYNGPLLDYLGFLLPILDGLHGIKGFPQGPIFLLIDDAHWLSETQARILNTWVSTRTSRKVSLKISTQYNYKSFYTINGSTIDTPHDYSEIDIATIYTGPNKSKYRDRISDIVNKRLSLFGIKNTSPEDFFPCDLEQEEIIQKIAEQYRDNYDNGKGNGYYRGDDANRYARPDFIKSLSGPTKSSSSYSYSGFYQLVHLSSGVVRFFLHPAHLMYAQEKSKTTDGIVDFIPASIQNEIIRQEANDFLFSDLENFEKGEIEEKPPKEDLKKLSNLIQGLGGLFRQILLSDRSERRVFSIAFSDTPSDEVVRILKLGILLGYFHQSTIGRKDSMSGGRTRLYVLNRRLAPIWNLDPTGFAGYLFITNSLVQESLYKPFSLLRRIQKEGLPSDTSIIQLELFHEGEL